MILVYYAGLNILVRLPSYIFRVLVNNVSMVAPPDFYVPLRVKVYLRLFFVVNNGSSGGGIMFL